MRPGVGASKPSPKASTTSTAKLTHRICSGASGAPFAMLKIDAPRNVRMNPASMIIWTRMYFIKLS